MRREIKELWKKADEIMMIHEAEEKMGCGFMPMEAHEYFNRLYGEVVEEIAKKRGFSCWNDYMFHEDECYRKAHGFVFN